MRNGGEGMEVMRGHDLVVSRVCFGVPLLSDGRVTSSAGLLFGTRRGDGSRRAQGSPGPIDAAA